MMVVWMIPGKAREWRRAVRWRRRAAFGLRCESKLVELKPAHGEIRVVAVRVAEVRGVKILVGEILVGEILLVEILLVEIKVLHPEHVCRGLGFVPVSGFSGLAVVGGGAELHAAGRSTVGGRGRTGGYIVGSGYSGDAERIQQHGRFELPGDAGTAANHHGYSDVYGESGNRDAASQRLGDDYNDGRDEYGAIQHNRHRHSRIECSDHDHVATVYDGARCHAAVHDHGAKSGGAEQRPGGQQWSGGGGH